MYLRLIVGVGLLSAATLATFGATKSEVADAAMDRNAEAVRALVSQKADVNVPQVDGTTALHWAVKWGDLATVDRLLLAGADVKAANREGTTPLFVACETGNAAIIEKLLKAGADANATVLLHGETALMMTARSGHVEAVKILLDHGAQVNAAENLNGTTAVMWAADENHPAVIKLLADHGADLGMQSKIVTPKPPKGGAKPAQSATQQLLDRNAEDYVPPPTVNGGVTALVIAARDGNMDSVRTLIAAGADVNRTSGNGSSPLLAAVQNGYYDVGAFLLDHGANPNLANGKGWTPLFMAVKNRNIETGTIPLPTNVGALEFIKLLLDRGADTNVRTNANTEVHSGFRAVWSEEAGGTPFFRAAMSGDLTVMRMLLAHGADPMIATTDHTTPLMAAAGVGWVDGFSHEYSERETLEAMTMLIDKGADVNAANDRGLTAMIGAAYKGASGAIQLLVDRGAKLDTRDKGTTGSFGAVKGGLTALDWAKGVPIGATSGIYHAETVDLLTRLMTERGIAIPADTRTLGGNAVVKVTQ